MNYDAFLSRAGANMQESAIRQMGTVLSKSKDMISFAPGYPAEDQFPWPPLTGNRPGVADRAPMGACCSTVPRAGTVRCARPRSR
jgi:hypothetical protein